MRPLIFAEPGSTAEGDLDRMLQLIRVAADAGCDVWKAQWVSRPERLCERRRAPEYLEAYRKIAWPADWHRLLRGACWAAGLNYACTVYLPEDVPLVAEHAEYVKVASFEAQASDVLDAALAANRPVIVSTGLMGTETVSALSARCRGERRPWAVLHCVSSYPAPLSDLNLGAIRTFRDVFGPRLRLGFSDHSAGVITGSWAVAAGAELLEIHYRLHDTPRENADYIVSLHPDELRDYVRLAREAAIALGDGIKRIMPAEADMLRYRVGGA